MDRLDRVDRRASGHRGSSAAQRFGRDGAGENMAICEFLTEDRILIALGSRNKEEVIAALAGIVCQSNQQVDHGTLYEALSERERQASTAFGDGIAVPHARCPGLTHTVAAFARSTEGIDF